MYIIVLLNTFNPVFHLVTHISRPFACLLLPACCTSNSRAMVAKPSHRAVTRVLPSWQAHLSSLRFRSSCPYLFALRPEGPTVDAKSSRQARLTLLLNGRYKSHNGDELIHGGGDRLVEDGIDSSSCAGRHIARAAADGKEVDRKEGGRSLSTHAGGRIIPCAPQRLILETVTCTAEQRRNMVRSATSYISIYTKLFPRF